MPRPTFPNLALQDAERLHRDAGFGRRRQREAVESGRVYLAPPERHLILTSPGVIGLAADETGRHPRPAADCLFESAAHVYGPRVIGVVLAGGGADGTVGLRAINAAGGIGVLEEADQASRSVAAMALRAPRANDADYRLPLDDIAELLRRLIDGDGVQPE